MRLSSSASRKITRTSVPRARSFSTIAGQQPEAVAAARIGADRHAGLAAGARVVDEARDQVRGQVVDAEEARVLERLQRHALARAGNARKKHQLHQSAASSRRVALLAHRLFLALDEFARGVDAAREQDVVAHRRLHQHGEVAARGHGERHRGNLDAEDVLRARARGEAIARLEPRGPGMSRCTMRRSTLRGRTAVSPKIERMLSTPRPRTSRKSRSIGGQRPWIVSGPICCSSTTSSATRPWPREMSSRASSLLPMEESPGDQHADLEHVEEDAVQRGDLAQLLLHVAGAAR